MMNNSITLSKHAKYIYNRTNHDINSIYTPLKNSNSNIKKTILSHFLDNDNDKKNISNKKMIEMKIKSMLFSFIIDQHNCPQALNHLDCYYAMIIKIIDQIYDWGKFSDNKNKKLFIDLTKLMIENYPLKIMQSYENLKILVNDPKTIIMNLNLVYADEKLSVYNYLVENINSLYKNKILSVIGCPLLMTIFKNGTFQEFKFIDYNIFSLIKVDNNLTYHKFNINNIFHKSTILGRG